MFANSPQQTETSSDLDARKETLASWRNLEEEISDLQDLIAQFSNIVTVAAGVSRIHHVCAVGIRRGEPELSLRFRLFPISSSLRYLLFVSLLSSRGMAYQPAELSETPLRNPLFS